MLNNDSAQTVYIIEDDFDLALTMLELVGSVGLKCQCFHNGIEFLDAIDSKDYGCIVTDMRLPGLGGLQIQDEINKKKLNLPIIFVTGFGEVDTAVRAMKNGAYDYISKPFNADALLEKIQSALRSTQSLNESNDAKQRFAILSNKELDVVREIWQGKTNKAIADILCVSIKTVEAHRGHIMKKLKVQSVAELIRLCAEANLFG